MSDGAHRKLGNITITQDGEDNDMYLVEVAPEGTQVYETDRREWGCHPNDLKSTVGAAAQWLLYVSKRKL